MADARPTSLLPLAAATLIALVAGPCALSSLAVRLGGVSELAHGYEEAGLGSYAATLAFGCSLLVIAIVAGIRAFGRAAPWTIAVAFALLPWLVGLAGEHLGIRVAASAIANADATSRVSMMAKGLAEAGHATAIGAWLSAALFGALALSAAGIARGEPATDRKIGLAAVSLPVVLALLVAIVFPIATDVGLRSVLGLLVAGGVAVVAAALGGAALGTSEPGRLGAASLAATLAALGAVAFAAVGELKLAESAGLGGFASADAERGSVVIARSVAAHGAAQWSAYALGLAVIVALGVVGALGVRRRATSRGALLDTGIALGCLLVAAALGLGSHARRVEIVEPMGDDANLDGVELVEMPPEARPGQLFGHVVVVDADGVRWIGREGVSFGEGHAALVERFRDTTWVQDIVLDAGADGEDLARALAAMQGAGIPEARIYGERAGSDTAAGAPAVLAQFLESPAAVPLDVCDLAEDTPSERVGRITSGGDLEVTERATGAAADLDPYGYDHVEVTFDPRADAPSLVRGLARGVGQFSTMLAFCARPAS